MVTPIKGPSHETNCCTYKPLFPVINCVHQSFSYWKCCFARHHLANWLLAYAVECHKGPALREQSLFPLPVVVLGTNRIPFA